MIIFKADTFVNLKKGSLEQSPRFRCRWFGPCPKQCSCGQLMETPGSVFVLWVKSCHIPTGVLLNPAVAAGYWGCWWLRKSHCGWHWLCSGGSIKHWTVEWEPEMRRWEFCVAGSGWDLSMCVYPSMEEVTISPVSRKIIRLTFLKWQIWQCYILKNNYWHEVNSKTLNDVSV